MAFSKVGDTLPVFSGGGSELYSQDVEGGATVTLTGTMTIAQNKWRDFVCTFTSATAATIRATAQGDYT